MNDADTPKEIEVTSQELDSSNSPERQTPPPDEPAQPEGPAGDAPPPKRRKSILGRILLFFSLVILAAGSFIAYDAAKFLHRPAGIDNPQDVIIDIAPGATFDRVAWDLYKAKAITSVWRFRLLAQLHKKLGAIQAGEFQVNTGWTPSRILQHLVSGRSLLYPLALREGLTWWEVAKLVEEGGFARAEAFKAVIHDPDFLLAYGIPFANAEGFLFPETYRLRKPKTLGGKAEAEAVARVLVEMFWKRNWPLLQEYTARSGDMGGAPVYLKNAVQRNGTLRFTERPAPSAAGAPRSATESRGGFSNSSAAASADVQTMPQVNATTAQAAISPTRPPLLAPVSAETLRRLVILATLVEKETAVPDERARVAGVYANRMRLGMLLQCDPTIIYGLGESFSGPIRRSQIADAKNPYNTYQNAGLPPGPICSPGMEALRAAANPETHKYLYFVAIGQTGAHDFSTNLDDHNKAVARYRATQK